jgi:hypothetical protein
MLKWLQKKRMQKNCTHDFLQLASYNGYTFLCKNCFKKKKFSWSWKAEEFELKQMILGHPTQTAFDYRFKYNKNLKQGDCKNELS